MTEPKRGDRVRVTYEAIYENAAGEGAHWLSAGDRAPLVPPGATIEVIKPEVEEPTAFGGVVEVDGNHWVRADDDSEPWRDQDGDWASWAELKRRGNITVLFDPDKAVADGIDATLHPDVRDDEGDLWKWVTGPLGPGYYLGGSMTTTYFKSSRTALEDEFGPLTEV